MACSTPPGLWDSVCRRVGRKGRVGWQREGVVIAVAGEAVVGKLAIGGSLWVVYGEAGH